MKKLILSLIAVAVGTLSSFAQSDLVATLSHGSSLSAFSGTNALSDAYAVAEEGDVITLSSGSFDAITIEKAITLRGAGCLMNPTTFIEPTILTGYLVINLPNDDGVFNMEGVNLANRVDLYGENLKHAKISKCYFSNGVRIRGCYPVFSQSIINGAYNSGTSVNWYQGSGCNCNTRADFFNCVVFQPSEYDGDGYTSTAKFDHCILAYPQNSSDSFLKKSIITNCIIVATHNTNIGTGCSVFNCLGTNSGATMFSSFPNGNNASEEDMNKVFKTMISHVFSVNETFELTETAASTYLGDDGTQVGIYGGTNPFNPTPTNPQVKKFTVTSTTEGDQLKVKINVE